MKCTQVCNFGCCICSPETVMGSCLQVFRCKKCQKGGKAPEFSRATIAASLQGLLKFQLRMGHSQKQTRQGVNRSGSPPYHASCYAAFRSRRRGVETELTALAVEFDGSFEEDLPVFVEAFLPLPISSSTWITCPKSKISTGMEPPMAPPNHQCNGSLA